MGNFDFESGRTFLAEGDFVEAIRCLLASLDQDPANVEAYLLLFTAYDAAWHESGDPLVLDQMRKVAIAGLKRDPAASQRDFLQQGLDATEELLARIQREEEEAAEAPREESGHRRSLPIIRGDPSRD